jgi:Amt family ammonium transporter
MGGDATLASEYAVSWDGRQLGLFGMTGFFLSPAVFTGPVAALFLFQMVFMDTAATIPTGAMAERWRFSSFVVFSLVISALIYPIYGNWVWGGGWLSTLGKDFGLGHGHVDFAGSSVVHMTGGVIALVGAKIIGPRQGKYGPRGEVVPIPGHNVAMVVLGTFILTFGWFGFNAGSTLAGSDPRIAVIAVNTMLASAGGAFLAYLHTKSTFGRPDLSMMCNGMLAGMVSITAPCAYVSAPIAMLIGSVAGVLVVQSALFIERRLRIDDPVGASSVHGVCGAWGILSVGLFANGTYGEGLNGVAGPVRGLLYGDPGQLAASMLGVGANLLFVGAAAALTLTILDKLVGNRASLHEEVQGLDIPELGAPGYMPDAAASLPGGSAPSQSQVPAASIRLLGPMTTFRPRR